MLTIRISVNAGHTATGAGYGAEYKGFRESEINRAVVKALIPKLQKLGYDISAHLCEFLRLGSGEEFNFFILAIDFFYGIGYTFIRNSSTHGVRIVLRSRHDVWSCFFYNYLMQIKLFMSTAFIFQTTCIIIKFML